jgi:uncharacterized repeat protein (TIGR03803 family)
MFRPLCFPVPFRKLLLLIVSMTFLVTQANSQSTELLYGVTNGTDNGLPNGYGHFFSFNPATGVVTSLHAFNGADGSSPVIDPVFLSDGYFYGTARSGGVNDLGVVYRIKPDGTAFQKLYDFNGTDGNDPSGGLASFCDGFLYGSTIQGGVNETFVLGNSLMTLDLYVYNRWGSRVYSKKDYQNDWSGEGLTAGVFFYFIVDGCGNTYKGPVSIIR